MFLFVLYFNGLSIYTKDSDIISKILSPQQSCISSIETNVQVVVVLDGWH